MQAPTTSAPTSKSCKTGHQKNCPVKDCHSNEEVRWVACGRQLLNPGAAVKVQDVNDALINGDKCSLSDARIGNVVLEYDEAKWHGDVDQDVRKMMALERHSLEMIVRLRRGKCPHLPIDPNCRTPVVLVHTNSRSTIVQMKATVEAMNKATAGAMNLKFDLLAMKAAVRTGDEAYKAIGTRTTAKIALLTTRYGNGAGPIFKVKGVKLRLLNGAFIEKLDRVHAMCGEDATRVCKFMCGSVAAALAGPDAEQFFESVSNSVRSASWTLTSTLLCATALRRALWARASMTFLLH